MSAGQTAARWLPPALFEPLLRAAGKLPAPKPYRFARYHGMSTTCDAAPLHEGRFGEIFDAHWRRDPGLDANWGRYRTYNVAMLAASCKALAGDFVFAGISYGVTPRVVYDYVGDEHAFYLIDPFTALNPLDKSGVSAFYNRDADRVRAQYPEHARVHIVRDAIPNALHHFETIAFAAFDTGHREAEAEAIPLAYERLVSGGVLMVENYGQGAKPFEHYDPVFARLGVTPIWFPSGQCAIIRR